MLQRTPKPTWKKEEHVTKTQRNRP